jgi:Na+-driven multidrug efflux pump
MIGAIGILSLGLIAVIFIPEMLIGIFTKDAILMELGLNGISIYSLTLPAVGICILGSVYFQSIGSAKKSIVLSLLRQVIIFIPLILLLPKHFGLNGVWAAQPIADIISVLIIGVFLIKEFKNRILISH